MTYLPKTIPQWQKWLHRLALSLGVALSLLASLWCVRSDIGLWFHYKLLSPGQSQSSVVSSLHSYYILAPGYMFNKDITTDCYWTPGSPWNPEAQDTLLVKADTDNGNYTFLRLTFKNKTLVEKGFCWD